MAVIAIEKECPRGVAPDIASGFVVLGVLHDPRAAHHVLNVPLYVPNLTEDLHPVAGDKVLQVYPGASATVKVPPGEGRMGATFAAAG